MRFVAITRINVAFLSMSSFPLMLQSQCLQLNSQVQTNIRRHECDCKLKDEEKTRFVLTVLNSCPTVVPRASGLYTGSNYWSSNNLIEPVLPLQILVFRKIRFELHFDWFGPDFGLTEIMCEKCYI